MRRHAAIPMLLSLEQRFWRRRELKDTHLSSALRASPPQKTKNRQQTLCVVENYLRADISPHGHWQTPQSSQRHGQGAGDEGQAPTW